MTVKDLLEILKGLPGQDEVVIADDYPGKFCPVKRVRTGIWVRTNDAGELRMVLDAEPGHRRVAAIFRAG